VTEGTVPPAPPAAADTAGAEPTVTEPGPAEPAPGEPAPPLTPAAPQDPTVSRETVSPTSGEPR
jgi:hypothetical protein